MPFMTFRRCVDADEIHFKYEKGKHDMANRKPAEYLYAKSNKEWMTTLPDYSFSMILEMDRTTLIDMLFRYWTNMEETCAYDNLISDKTSYAWWNRTTGIKVFRSNLHGVWFFAGDWKQKQFETFGSVLHFYVSSMLRNRIPPTLPDPKQMRKGINMRGFDRLINREFDA